MFAIVCFTFVAYFYYFSGSHYTNGSTTAETVDKCFAINAVDLSRRYRD